MESIPESCKGWSEIKAAYRFFGNSLVTAKKVIKPHRLATLNRIKEHPIVLLLQDTTTLNYSGQKEREDIGPIQQDNVRGIFLHPTLAITPNRECLGVIDYEQWSREKFTHRSAQERRTDRYSKAIKDKAQLGGFIERKHDGDPGLIVMWKGLRNLYEHIRAREAFTRAFGHTYG